MMFLLVWRMFLRLVMVGFSVFSSIALLCEYKIIVDYKVFLCIVECIGLKCFCEMFDVCDLFDGKLLGISFS